MCIGIVDAEVPGAHPMLELFVPAEAQIKPVVISHPEIVPLNGGNHAIVSQSRINLHAKGAAIAGTEHPCGGEIEMVAERMLHRNADVMPPVVFGGENLSVVNLLSFAVKFPVGMRPGIGHPTGCGAKRTLQQELHAVSPAPAHAHL